MLFAITYQPSYLSKKQLTSTHAALFSVHFKQIFLSHLS